MRKIDQDYMIYKLRIICSILACLVITKTNAQIQKGMDLDGEAIDDFFGHSVSMPDAKTMAVGGPNNDGNGSGSGHVRVYRWNGRSWVQKGIDIDGEAAGDASGIEVSMPDSSTVAIGAFLNQGKGSRAGHVRVYKWNGSAWVQKGIDIDAEAAGDESGRAVSMPDSNTVAIGAFDNDGNGSDAGHVRVYKWNGSAWIQKGSDIDGEAAKDFSGYSVNMPDSNTVAIGAIGNDGSGTNAGHVRVYRWNGSSWVQKGSDIDGEAAYDFSGYSVSMPDTNTVAIGAANNDGNGYRAGHVRIYRWNGNAWVQKGSDIDGEAARDHSGWSISMPDSNTLAIGAPYNGGNGFNSGHVRVYKWNGSAYLQRGLDIDGDTASNLGQSVCMPNSSTLVLGAPYDDGNGSQSGSVRVYNFCSSTSAFSVSACDSYTVPSADETYTTSQMVRDTVSNTAGCDSVMTINVIINRTDTAFSVSACDSYTVPSGDETYTSSQMVMDTIPNAAGCDSLMTINVIINRTDTTFSVQACDSYTVPSGDETYTFSQSAMDTIPNSAGCDSVMTINVIIENTTSAFSVSACNSYTVPSGDETYTTSQTVMDTIPNTAGCDSVMTINVMIDNTKSTFSVSACYSYTVPSGDETYTTSQTVMDTITNKAGCDSVMAISVSINSTTSAFSVSACESYTVPSGDETYTTSQIVMDTITNNAGCDSVMTISLSIDTVDISVTNNSPSLLANAMGSTYQWLDCSNSFAIIPGETNQQFTATANGNYAVEVHQNGCTDTSACELVNNVGILENSFGADLVVFPNPTKGQVKVELGGSYINVVVIVRNSLGQETLRKNTDAANGIDLFIEGESGVYFLEIRADDKKATLKVLKE
ncbi:MAG: T9SS type A sorting domain-containing protein [Bacteroidia bacterium]